MATAALAQTKTNPISRPKMVRLSLNADAIVVLATEEATPQIEGWFKLLEWHVSKNGRDIEYVIQDQDGNTYPGRGEPQLLHENLTVELHSPVFMIPSKYGMRVTFLFRLPYGHRVHHLAFMRRNFPALLDQLEHIA